MASGRGSVHDVSTGFFRRRNGGWSVNVGVILLGSNGQIHRVFGRLGRTPGGGTASASWIWWATAAEVGEGGVEALAQMARETACRDRGHLCGGPFGQVAVLDAEAVGWQAAALHCPSFGEALAQLPARGGGSGGVG